MPISSDKANMRAQAAVEFARKHSWAKYPCLAAVSVIPIIAVVSILCLFFTPVEPELLLCFLIGAIMLVLGMGLFSLGAEHSMTPIGNKVGAALTDIYNKYRKEFFEDGNMGEFELAAIAVSTTDLFTTLGKKDICSLFEAGYPPVISFMENVMHCTSKGDEALLEKLLKKFKGMIENGTDA